MTIYLRWLKKYGYRISGTLSLIIIVNCLSFTWKMMLNNSQHSWINSGYGIINRGISPNNLTPNTCMLDFICSETRNNVSFVPKLEKSNFTYFSLRYGVTKGGNWEPPDCKPGNKLAIIIPYRDRKDQLNVFVTNIILFLQSQKKAFTIFVVEQVGDELFNKAILMNAGFLELDNTVYDCVIFHDVDMIPVNLCNTYQCPHNAVRHLGLSRNLTRPHYVWPYCIGGVSAFTPDMYRRINGFTNLMYGWGGEDNDGYQSASAWDHWRFMKYDGLNNIKYKVNSIHKEELFTRICVSIPDGIKQTEDIRPYFMKHRRIMSEMYNITN